MYNAGVMFANSTKCGDGRLPKTVTFRTFGCKQNQYDTDFLRESFAREGFVVIEETGGPQAEVDAPPSEIGSTAPASSGRSTRDASAGFSEPAAHDAAPDVVVINTCAVTSRAAAKCSRR
jgi:tRNA A37 methylthiotransferase MiaB